MEKQKSDQLKVLIVEDHLIVRIGLKMVLQNDFNIVGEAEDGMQSVRLTKELNPDVVLMDVGLPIIDGVKATKMIKLDVPATRIIMLTSHNSEQNIFDALEAGADGYCLKEISGPQLSAAIRAVAAGAAWLDPSIASHLLSRAQPIPSTGEEGETLRPGDFALSEVELVILRLVVEGLGNNEIATRTSIGLITIRSAMRQIIDKMSTSLKATRPDLKN